MQVKNDQLDSYLSFNPKAHHGFLPLATFERVSLSINIYNHQGLLSAGTMAYQQLMVALIQLCDVPFCETIQVQS